MNPHKLIEFYFQCLDDAGEKMTFELVKFKTDKIEELSFNHLHYDGASALCEVLTTLPGSKKLPSLKVSSPPSIWKRWWMATLWWYRVSYRPFYRPNGIGKGEYLSGFRTLEVKDETNLNSKILLALHRAMRTQKKTLWMLPVSLHPKLSLAMPTQNNVSFIDVKVGSNDSEFSLRQNISRQLKSGTYWGTIYSMLIPKLLGKKLFLKTFPYFHYFLRRTGTFTNLGKWEVENLKESWGIRATVVPLNPVGASALQINSSLTLGLQLHPCLKLTKDELNQILDNWQSELQTQWKN